VYSVNHKRTNHLVTKILLVGGLIAGLIYLFHPEAGQFSVVINGEPLSDPLVRFAVIPTMLAVLFFTGILIVLTFFGVGLFVFLGALLFMMLGVFLVAPYAWPVLVIIFLTIALISFDNTKSP